MSHNKVTPYITCHELQCIRQTSTFGNVFASKKLEYCQRALSGVKGLKSPACPALSPAESALPGPSAPRGRSTFSEHLSPKCATFKSDGRGRTLTPPFQRGQSLVVKQCEGKFDESARLLSVHSCGIRSPWSVLGKLVPHRYFGARVAFPSLLAPNICV